MPTVFVPEPHLLDSPRGRDWPFPAALGGAARLDEPPRTADAVIVGAGPAGLAVAAALWHHGVRDLVLFDRGTRPCGRFFDRVDTLGQRVLRSPYEHHPGAEGYRDCELLDFARLNWARLTPVERREVRMAQAGHRSVVPVDVFEAYCAQVASTHRVTERTWQANVHAVLPGKNSVTVRAGEHEVSARFVVLCTGEERRQAPAGWWPGRETPEGVRYWDERAAEGADELIVVGAGLSAAHLVANGLAGGAKVHWVFRETGERYQCADVNSSFFRPEGRNRFDSVNWEDRLGLMRTFRRASVMFEFRPGLERAEAEGRLVVHRGRQVTGVGTGEVRLADGSAVRGDQIALALGTVPWIGDQLLPDEVVGERNGWPDLDERSLAYCRAPRVFAVGAAAGMALGPAARNIDGHRVATARVAAAVAHGVQRGEPLLTTKAVASV
ncbi:FAD-dependent oxidoreductase [Amycolatopsis lurida]